MPRSGVTTAFFVGAKMVSGFRKALGSCALVVMLWLPAASAFAQYVDWIGYGPGGTGYGYTGSSSRGRRPIAFDDAGNSFIAGWAKNQNNHDPMVIKQGNDGTIVWQKRLATPEYATANNVVVDHAGDVIVSSNANNYPEFATYVVKYSAAGEQRWKRRLTDPSGSFSVADLAIDGTGHWYLLAYTGDTKSPTVVTRFNPEGEAIWTLALPERPDSTRFGNAILAVGGDGAAYVCASVVAGDNRREAGFSLVQIVPGGTLGWQRSVDGALSCADFGLDRQSRISVISASPQGLAAFQFGPDGAQRWATSIASAFNGPRLALDTVGDLSIISGDYTVSPQLARIDGATGQLIWTRTIAPASNRQWLTIDAAGMVYVVTRMYEAGGSGSTISASKFNAAGDVVWNFTLTPPRPNSDSFWTASATPAGDLLVAGDNNYEGTLLIRRYGSDGSLLSMQSPLPLHELPQRVQVWTSYRYKQVLVAAGDGYFANSVVWSGWRWECHVDRFSGTGALRWSHTPVTPDSVGDCENIEIAADRFGNHYTAQFLPASCPVSTSREHFVLNHFEEAGQPGWQRVVWNCADPQRPSDAQITASAEGIVYVVGARNEGTEIVAYASNGEESWRHRYGLILPSEARKPIHFDASGNMVLAGWTTGGVAVAKISPQGLLVWQFVQPVEEGFPTTPKDLAIGSNGEIALIMRQTNYPTPGWATHVARTILLAEDGTYRWSRLWSSPVAGQDDAANVAIDTAGNVLVTVTSLPYIDQSTPRIGSAVVVRYGRDGTKHWERFVQPGEWADANVLTVDRDDNAWLVMTTDDGNDNDNEHMAVAKVATDGTLLWTFRANSGNASLDRSHAALMSTDGALILSATVNEYSGSDQLALIRLSDQPRADRILMDGFDGATFPVNASGTATEH